MVLAKLIHNYWLIRWRGLTLLCIFPSTPSLALRLSLSFFFFFHNNTQRNSGQIHQRVKYKNKSTMALFFASSDSIFYSSSLHRIDSYFLLVYQRSCVPYHKWIWTEISGNHLRLRMIKPRITIQGIIVKQIPQSFDKLQPPPPFNQDHHQRHHHS